MIKNRKLSAGRKEEDWYLANMHINNVVSKYSKSFAIFNGKENTLLC